MKVKIHFSTFTLKEYLCFKASTGIPVPNFPHRDCFYIESDKLDLRYVKQDRDFDDIEIGKIKPLLLPPSRHISGDAFRISILDKFHQLFL